MFKNQSNNEIIYILPEDGTIAKESLLQLFDLPNIEIVYINAYGITLDSLVEKIKQLDDQKIPVHILSDYMQSRGKSAWEIAKDLKQYLKYGSITLTTAGINIKNSSAIYHHKNLTIRFKDQTPINFLATANFSNSSWEQGNVCTTFSSQEFSDNIVEYFNTHKQWALKNRADKQIDNNEFQILSEIDDIDESNEKLYDMISLLESDKQKLINQLSLWKIICVCTIVLMIFCQK